MNPFEVLGVEADATPEQLKKARQKLAKKHHPDRQGGDAGKMQEVNKAYDILIDPEARKRYDETGSTENVQSIDEAAMDTLRQAIQDALSRPDELENVNIFARIRRKMTQARGQFEAQQIEAQRHIVKIEKKLKKIECTSGSNFVQQLFDQRVQELIGRRNALQKGVAVLERCEELLKVYNDQTVEGEPQSMSDAFMQQIQNFRFR